MNYHYLKVINYRFSEYLKLVNYQSNYKRIVLISGNKKVSKQAKPYVPIKIFALR